MQYVEANIAPNTTALGCSRPPDKLWGSANSRMEMSATAAQDVYEIRPREDRDGFDPDRRSAARRPNLVCRTRRSPPRGRAREVPLSLSLAPGDHPRV